DALVRLGWHYRESGRYDQAAAELQRAVKLYPGDPQAYAELGQTLVRRGSPRQATAMYEKAAELQATSAAPYLTLGMHHLALQDYARAERALQKAVSLNPELDRTYAGLATCYALMGRPALAQEYLDRANALRESSYVAMTRENYRALAELVRRSGARLVCVQYPRRSVAALKNLFDDASGILFVDNEGPFEEALRTAPATELFVDFYAGDFGHCTDWGYRLLAKNIADVIWEEGAVR
ncbi:MAG: tetratricopeptide repeat protein, partial [Elusimicrobia bacterium]|nr:tetratricopeptide repeat protein [Elusimicrobiota bacterium]